MLGKLPGIQMSRPLFRYFDEHQRYISFFMFVNNLASRADEVRVTAAEALLKVYPEEAQEARRYREMTENPSLVFDQLKAFADIQSRNLLLTAVNNFLCYFSEAIQAAMAKRPEMLRSSATMRVDEVLTFRRRSELVAYLVDRQVNELSYGGLLRMEEYMRDRLGIEPFITEDSRSLMIVAIELRNVHTHARGIINDLFLGRVKEHMGFKFVRGRRFHVDLDEFANIMSNNIEVACRIDTALASKFGIRRKRFSAWRATS
ncbi:MAG TPA: hypothetical protein VNW53_09060 [Phenylobacterium sp.]|uniref:hypothetical protein n=1 Tax=Phenylobacterium sp. TaxID=1871053 RepID=UPI002BBA73FA|nr:hypothetical protein [Phenylobacterium sp.]HXA39136.1 hypothetical protein [Phenylobacterium sp.]